MMPYNLLLADDDPDDCIFFREALDDLPFTSYLATVNDGVALMQALIKQSPALPDVLFLDLNMPRKTGFECLTEIKQHPVLKFMPVVIASTSFDMEVINLLYEKGATCYMRKPGDFSKLRQIIHLVIDFVLPWDGQSLPREKFVLQSI